MAQSQQASTVRWNETAASGGAETGASTGEQHPVQQLSGGISGTVLDPTGALAVGAQVQISNNDQSVKQEVVSGDNGEYSFARFPAGPFTISISAPGFSAHSFSGVARPDEAFIVPPIMLSVTAAVTEVQVQLSQEEVAAIEVKEQEKQYVLGIIPNFYASYVSDAAPLTPKQKFGLAWKSTTAPFTFVAVGVLAGIEQAADEYGGYGQGVEGYAKRFGAAYANVLVGTYIGSAILPTLLKQDPRYFYKGTGSKKSRLLYALGNAVISKGDNKQWQPNYSGIIGSFATGGISYLYTPANDRSAEIVIQNSLIRIAESAVAGVFQEFVLRKLTPHVQNKSQSQDQP